MRQSIAFNLVRTANLTAFEMWVLHFIASFSTNCRPPSLKIMAQHMGYSERHLRRTIKALTIKGLVIKKYTYYKRVILTVPDLQFQRKWLKDRFSTLADVVNNQWKFGKNKVKQIVNPDRTSMSYPNIEETKDNTDLKIKGKLDDIFGPKSDLQIFSNRKFDLNETRRMQLKALEMWKMSNH